MPAKGYYTVVPCYIRDDMRLPDGCKLMFGDIAALCGKDGKCWATNAYLAKVNNAGKSTISHWISKLVECGHLDIEIIRDSYGMITERILKIAIPVGIPGHTPLSANGQYKVVNSTEEINTEEVLGPKIGPKTPVTGKALWGNCKHDLQRFMSYYVRRFNTPLYESGTKEQRDGFYKQYTHFFKVLLDTAGTLDIACQALDNADSYYRSLNLNWGMKTLNTNWSEFVSKAIEMRR